MCDFAIYFLFWSFARSSFPDKFFKKAFLEYKFQMQIPHFRKDNYLQIFVIFFLQFSPHVAKLIWNLHKIAVETRASAGNSWVFKAFKKKEPERTSFIIPPDILLFMLALIDPRFHAIVYLFIQLYYVYTYIRSYEEPLFNLYTHCHESPIGKSPRSNIHSYTTDRLITTYTECHYRSCVWTTKRGKRSLSLCFCCLFYSSSTFVHVYRQVLCNHVPFGRK